MNLPLLAVVLLAAGSVGMPFVAAALALRTAVAGRHGVQDAPATPQAPVPTTEAPEAPEPPEAVPYGEPLTDDTDRCGHCLVRVAIDGQPLPAAAVLHQRICPTVTNLWPVTPDMAWAGESCVGCGARFTPGGTYCRTYLDDVDADTGLDFLPGCPDCTGRGLIAIAWHVALPHPAAQYVDGGIADLEQHLGGAQQ